MGCSFENRAKRTHYLNAFELYVLMTKRMLKRMPKRMRKRMSKRMLKHMFKHMA